jgi:hypothetical protein
MSKFNPADYETVVSPEGLELEMAQVAMRREEERKLWRPPHPDDLAEMEEEREEEAYQRRLQMEDEALERHLDRQLWKEQLD